MNLALWWTFFYKAELLVGSESTLLSLESAASFLEHHGAQRQFDSLATTAFTITLLGIRHSNCHCTRDVKLLRRSFSTVCKHTSIPVLSDLFKRSTFILLTILKTFLCIQGEVDLWPI